MSFWNLATEPLRKNRWTMIVGNIKNGEEQFTYALKKCDKPSYKTSDITHKFGNYNFYYPGRVEWNTINVTFASVPFVDNAILNILKNAGYAPPFEERAALQAATKWNFSQNVGSLRIKQLSADAQPIETWDLVYPFFTNVKFGDLSYDSEEILDVEVTIRFDTAIYNKDTVYAEKP